MPLPKPNSGESQNDFMKRCMGDAKMGEEYSDPKQRLAVCMTQFSGKDEMSEDIIETGHIEIEAEIKALSDEDNVLQGEGYFEGYASVFNNVDLGSDVMEKGAFTKSLRRRGTKGVKMLYQHDQKQPIGVYKSIKEDGDGLYVKGQLAMGTQKGKETFELMKMGAIDGLSIGYRVGEKGYHYDDKRKRRYLKEVDLMEISAVTFPMNPRARIQAVKSDRTVREWEEILREAGDLSRSEAKIAAAALAKSLGQRDADDAKLLGSISRLTQILKSE